MLLPQPQHTHLTLSRAFQRPLQKWTYADCQPVRGLTVGMVQGTKVRAQLFIDKQEKRFEPIAPLR